MMTIKEVSRLTGVSARTLRYYDALDLLPPSSCTLAGYRLYDESALQRLQQILLFRELELPLKDIKAILDEPSAKQEAVLNQQIALLEQKQERLTQVIAFAKSLQALGGNTMDFSVFDTKKMEAYTEQARSVWGDTEAFREFDAKTEQRSTMEQKASASELMEYFVRFGQLRHLAPDAPEVQAQVMALQAFITAHYYRCDKTILAGLGEMYVAGGEMTENIDAVGGAGTAVFTAKAIAVYCA